MNFTHYYNPLYDYLVSRTMDFHTYYTRVILVGSLLLGALTLGGQAVFRFDTAIHGLGLDAQGRILIMSFDSNYHQIIDKQLQPSDHSPVVESHPKYRILDEQLIEQLGEVYHRYASTTPIYDVVTYRGQQIVAGDSGLQLFENGQFKNFHIPGVTFPQALRRLAVGGDQLAIITQERELYVFDLKEHYLKLIEREVDHCIWDKWNTLWYTQGGTLNLDVSYVNQIPPILNITGLKDASGTELEWPTTIKTGSDLSFSYTSIYPPQLDEPKLVYRLNANADWKKVTSDSPLRLRDLSAGAYQIQLRAEGLNGVTTFTEPLRLRVETEWLSKLWKILSGILLAMLVLAMLSSSRLKSQLSKLQAEKEKIQLRVELDEKRQKIGQLQMNPHLIFNTLNSISGLIALNENKKARKYLNQFSQMMRKMLDGTRKDFLSLKEEKSFLEQYLSLEAMSRNDAFDFEVLIDEDLDEQSHIPAMILQPLVENAIIHGIAHKKEKGKVTVQFQKEGKYIKATVEDDGIGRDAAQAYRSETHNSAAMDIIKERLAALDKWNKTGIVYTDLKNENGEAAGTRVEVVLSVR